MALHDHHHHDHRYGHGHAHSHAPADYLRAFAIGIALNSVVAVERSTASSPIRWRCSPTPGTIFGRARAGGRLGRRGHGQARAVAALHLRAQEGADPRGAANALLLLVAVGAIGAEAVRRLLPPVATQGGTVMIVAAVGIVVNGATALLFARGRERDINIRGAYLHMAADAAVSAAVVVAGS